MLMALHHYQKKMSWEEHQSMREGFMVHTRLDESTMSLIMMLGLVGRGDLK